MTTIDNIMATSHDSNEPVAWGMINSRSGQIYDCISPAQHAEHEGSYTVPLYTAPQPQPKQEPVAYGMLDTQLGRTRLMMVRLDKGQDGCTVPLYTAAPQPQQWVGLTTEDRVKILRLRGEAAVCEATEAKLREKNGGGV